MATRVAILGAWLGIIALLLAFAGVELVKSWLACHVGQPDVCALAISVIFGIVCIIACRGANVRPLHGHK